MPRDPHKGPDGAHILISVSSCNMLLLLCTNLSLKVQPAGFFGLRPNANGPPHPPPPPHHPLPDLGEQSHVFFEA